MKLADTTSSIIVTLVFLSAMLIYSKDDGAIFIGGIMFAIGALWLLVSVMEDQPREAFCALFLVALGYLAIGNIRIALGTVLIMIGAILAVFILRMIYEVVVNRLRGGSA